MVMQAAYSEILTLYLMDQINSMIYCWWLLLVDTVTSNKTWVFASILMRISNLVQPKTG